MKKRRAAWEAKGLYILFLPVYSPELNIAEILWRELKYEWLQPGDYESKPAIMKASHCCVTACGKS
ncbi:MAG: transposase [Fibrella sp.]|nr:transposase [Armatimonadota bacterium]